MDWLLEPIDPSRAHVVDFAISWHGRAMVLAWGVMVPLAILVARFFKVTPGQDWPRELDNQFWWRSHWMGQSCALVVSLVGLLLVLPSDPSTMTLHNWLGYGLLGLLGAQFLLGVLRGTKGGPTAPAEDGSTRGDHYDMTPRRKAFEALHKSLGYMALLLAAVVILLGLWKANGPVWMWIAILLWWGGLLIAFRHLQRTGRAVDTYQAIWGDDPTHPGNRIGTPGWGMTRPGETREHKGADHVRSDRGDGIRGHRPDF